MRFETINLGVPGPPGPGSTVPGPQGPQGLQGIPGPPGGESGSVNGIAALRAMPPVSGQTLQLNYHTTPGDLGAGMFVGTTTGGPYADNDGTIIVPTGGDGSAAWLRVWDHVRAHVGWFGAKCDPDNVATDDYLPVQRCINLFTDGRHSHPVYGVLSAGIVDVGPGFCFSQPLIYGGSLNSSFKLVGAASLGRGGYEKSLVRYTGPKTHASIIFYGANEWVIDDINVWPQLALSGVLITADNSYNNSGEHRTTHAITAGNNVVVTPTGATAAEKVVYLQSGVFLGVDDGGPNFEIVYITAVDTTAGTFTADFTKNHVTNTLLGGGAPCSSGFVNRCRLACPESPIWTTISGPSVDLGGGIWRFPVTDITGIKVGHPVRVGSFILAQVVHPTAVGASYFDAPSYGWSYAAGEIVMYPTSGIAFGNRLIGTVQVDNVTMSSTVLVGSGPIGPLINRCYAGFRQIWGGNVKAFLFNDMFPAYLRVAFACEQSSGQYKFNGGTSAAIEETIWQGIVAHLTVIGWEDEGSDMWLAGALGGANACQANFIGCTMQGSAPDFSIPGASDTMFAFIGNINFFGCDLRNNRIYPTTIPIIVSVGVLTEGMPHPSSVTIIGSHIANVTPANIGQLIRNAPLDTTDVLKIGTGKVTLLNNSGGYGGAVERLPDVLPPLRMWQGTATYDPASIAAGAVGAAQTMTVSGAALGDLVEASFSLDLQGVGINAWVSAADTVKYQFRNPTAAPIDLGSGTVKCRVKK
jgi:hypothetical protein